MARNPSCTLFIGNLDEKVNERVLYEILIQVGRIVDLYIPRDKETNRHRGYAFAEYESEEIANYAVRLFSGLVRLHNRILRFAISGQDKLQNNVSSKTPKQNSPPIPRPNPVQVRELELPQETTSIASCSFSAHSRSNLPNDSQVSSNGFLSNGFIASNFEYSRRVFGSVMNTVSYADSRRAIEHPSY